MNKHVFTNEEIEFLLNNINRVVEIFRDTHDEVLVAIEDNNINIYDLMPSNLSLLFTDNAETAYSYGFCLEFAFIMKSFIPKFSYCKIDNKDHILLEYEKKHIDIRGVLEDNLSKEELERERFSDADEKYFYYATNNFGTLPKKIFDMLVEMFYKNLKEYLKSVMPIQKSKNNS